MRRQTKGKYFYICLPLICKILLPIHINNQIENTQEIYRRAVTELLKIKEKEKKTTKKMKAKTTVSQNGQGGFFNNLVVEAFGSLL